MRTELRRLLLLATYALRTVFASRIVFAFPLAAALVVFAGAELLEVDLGTPSLPTTARVLPLLGDLIVTAIVGVLTTLYAGELVWKERETRMHAMADATPVRDWMNFLAKFLALALMLVAVQAMLLASGIALQAVQGYTNFELGLYVRVLFGLRLADALLFAVLAMTVHVLVNHKFVGHAIAMLGFLYMHFAKEIGIDRELLIYGSDVGWTYSDMNGFGGAIVPWLWFKAYWLGWAVLLAVLAKACWPRGAERRVRFSRVSIEAAAAAGIVIAITGGFIFRNTEERREPQAGPRPVLSATKLHVELHPKRRAFTVRGAHRMGSRVIPVDVRYEPSLFAKSPVAENGTFFDPYAWLPPAGDDHSRIDFEAIVGTDEDQYVVAPGTLKRTWTENGRRYFHYAADVPIRNLYAFFSARYAVRKARWNGIPIEVYHHPGHTANVDRIVRSAQASLAYYTRHFGPYPYRSLRFVEYPRGSMLLRAYPGTIMYSEAFAVVNPADDARHLDLPFAVMAHEIAHQWWGNQLIPANADGAPVLTESLAWYSAMMVVEDTYGKDHLWRLVDMMRREYLTPRRKAGVPLLRATNHFDVYRKGPFAMFALRDAAGAEKINAALRGLLGKESPTSLDLYAQLRTVAPAALLEDLFATNTYWELQTTAVRAEPLPRGQWRVTLDVRARKSRVDTLGREREVPMSDEVAIGVYDDEELYLRKHRIHSGRQTITVIVPRKPSRAGVDPEHVLIEAKRDDNLRAVS